MPSARDLLSGLYAHLLNRTFSVYWAARAPHVLRWLGVRQDDDVLEVGCGSGSWSAYLAPRAGSYTALDLSLDAIEGARAVTS